MIDLLTDLGAIFRDRMKRAARRQMASALMVGVALLFLGVAVVAGIVAIGVVLAARWGVLTACLIIAGVAFLIAVLLVVLAARQARKARLQQQADLAQLRQTMLAAKVIATEMTRSKSLMVATIFGMLVGLKATKRPPRDDT